VFCEREPSVKTGLFVSITATAIVVAVTAVGPVSAVAQTPAAATWTPPRTPDGQPDIQGYWIAGGPTGGPTFPIYTLEGGDLYDVAQTSVFGGGGALRGPGGKVLVPQSVVVDPPSGKIPYQAWALAKRQEHFENHTHPTKAEYIDGRARCYLPGVPRTIYSGNSQFVQSPGYVVLLNEYTHAPRIIPLEKRPHLGEGIRLWQGDSRGHWDGNTLIVETTNTNTKWLDIIGDFHSDSLKVVERFNFTGPDQIRYEATLEDPKVFTRPWKIGLILRRNKEPGFELLEEACHEGERDSTRMLHDTPGAGPQTP
jgi:hypothetical protein